MLAIGESRRWVYESSLFLLPYLCRFEIFQKEMGKNNANKMWFQKTRSDLK